MTLPTPYCKVREAADWLRITEHHVLTLMRNGKIRWRKLTGMRLVNLYTEDVLRILPEPEEKI